MNLKIDLFRQSSRPKMLKFSSSKKEKILSSTNWRIFKFRAETVMSTVIKSLTRPKNLRQESKN
jgi:hypothetical protein